MVQYFDPTSHIARLLSPLLIVTILCTAFVFVLFPRQVHASVPTHCTSFLDLNCIKELILDILVRPAVAAALATIVQTTVGWITGNGGADVGFMDNFEQNVFERLNARGAEFLNRLAGINLCNLRIRNFLLSVRFRVPTIVGGYNQLGAQMGCTITSIIGNTETFYRDFSVGGWEAFLETTQGVQNNYIGASIIAEANFDQSVMAQLETFVNTQQANNGFMGMTIKIPSRRCEMNTEGPAAGTESCLTETKVTTPGSLVKEALKKQLVDTPADFIMPADELSELIGDALGAIVNALIGEMMSGNLFK